MVRGREYADALAALDKIATLGHFRSETVQRAVGATLACIGARRLRTANTGDTEGAGDRRLLRALAELEAAAAHLDELSPRGTGAEIRRLTWAEIVDKASKVRTLVSLERSIREARNDNGRSP